MECKDTVFEVQHVRIIQKVRLFVRIRQAARWKKEPVSVW